MIFIYTLSSSSDPNNIRYIGKTKNIIDRIRRHIGKYYLNLEDNYKNRWIKSELNKGNEILIEEIDLVEEENWKESEKYWIEQFRNWGFNLVNTTEGGDGLVLTKEIIEKRSKTRIKNNFDRLQKEAFFFNIKKDNNGQWNGERLCSSCNTKVSYHARSFHRILYVVREGNKRKYCISCLGMANSSIKTMTRKYGKKILQYDINMKLINEFESINSASKFTGINKNSISRCARNLKWSKTAGGFLFKYKVE